MSDTIIVSGMHCDACKKLVRMELEDAGLDSFVLNIQVDQEQNRGTLTLKDGAGENNTEEIRNVINSMEGYSTE